MLKKVSNRFVMGGACVQWAELASTWTGGEEVEWRQVGGCGRKCEEVGNVEGWGDQPVGSADH